MSETEREGLGIVSRFPFVMVLTTTLLRGMLFLFLNFPLLYPVLNGNSYGSIAGLFKSEYLDLLAELPTHVDTGAGIFLLFLLVAFALVLGLILAPVDLAVSFALAALSEQIYNKIRRPVPKIAFFSSRSMLGREYSRLLEWFFTYTSQRSHWEWELFHFYVSWTLFVNLAIYSGSVVFLLRSIIRLHEIFLILVANIAMLIFALLRSRVMANVHSLYIEHSSH
jgi:hypothetical protein